MEILHPTGYQTI